MSKYHKINGPFKRDMTDRKKPLIMGDWAVDVFELLQDIEWIGHEKIDGTNIRICFDGETVRFEGRNDSSSIPAHLLNYLKDKFTYELMKEKFPAEESEVVLYGEGTGYKIQSGCKYFNGEKVVSFILFDVKVGDWWLIDEAVTGIALDLNIFRAPEIIRGTLSEIMTRVKQGFMSMYGNFYAEGIVAKPKLNLFTRRGDRIITKIKHRDFYEAN